jgi:hypothetical protein
MSAGNKASDEEHYANAGAEWYAGLAEMLRDQRAGGQVFKNKRAVGELTSRKRRMRSDGRYELEPKHEAQKRGARSPDWGDAIAMCFAPRVRTGRAHRILLGPRKAASTAAATTDEIRAQPADSHS